MVVLRHFRRGCAAAAGRHLRGRHRRGMRFALQRRRTRRSLAEVYAYHLTRAPRFPRFRIGSVLSSPAQARASCAARGGNARARVEPLRSVLAPRLCTTQNRAKLCEQGCSGFPGQHRAHRTCRRPPFRSRKPPPACALDVSPPRYRISPWLWRSSVRSSGRVERARAWFAPVVAMAAHVRRMVADGRWNPWMARQPYDSGRIPELGAKALALGGRGGTA